jgi:hypothetical protein
MGERTSTPSAGARRRPVKADGPPERAFPLVRRLCAFALRKPCNGFTLVEPDQGTEEYRQARVAVPLAQASDASTCTQGSPFAGWLSVIDEQGVPTLYRVAYAPANALCVQAVAQTGGGSKALTGQRPDSTMGSPSLGWVLVIDEQGVPTLFPSGQVSS